VTPTLRHTIVDPDSAEPRRPPDVVLGFLHALADEDLDTALSLVADDIVYTNVSLPTIRGKDRFARAAHAFYRCHMGFEVSIHRIAENGSVVMTERTDALILGPLRTQFWICGVFEVNEGQISLWRDYFDWYNVLFAALRGLIGAVVPPLRTRLPDAMAR
jgi:limonene-1,2-epoxide hydrolase